MQNRVGNHGDAGNILYINIANDYTAIIMKRSAIFNIQICALYALPYMHEFFKKVKKVGSEKKCST